MVPASAVRLLEAETQHIVDLGMKELPMEELVTKLMSDKKMGPQLGAFITRYSDKGTEPVPKRLDKRARRAAMVAASLNN